MGQFCPSSFSYPVIAPIDPVQGIVQFCLLLLKKSVFLPNFFLQR